MNNGLPMLVVTALVLLASTALAYQLWLERDGDLARLYFDGPVENLYQPGDGLLDRITGPRVLAANPSGDSAPARHGPAPAALTATAR